jgi:progressive ankylosis protein
LPLRLSRVLAFWLPLAATWIMMAVEGPFLSGVVARMGTPVMNLAAFGLAFNLAWMAESPVIMLLSASIALAKDRPSYLALRRFVNLLNAGVTLFLVVIVLPPVFHVLTLGILGLPADVAALAHRATLLLLPWPAAIGTRRLFQGLLVRSNQTRKVAHGTVVRLGGMALTATLLALLTHLPGAIIGAMALTVGVVGEALAARIMAGPALRALADSPEPPPTQRELVNFYVPLALTSMLSMATSPLLILFMGRAADPVPCLAAWPVVSAFLFFFRSGGIAFQEVSVALRGPEASEVVRRAATLLAVFFTALLAVIVATPLARIWYHGVVHLDTSLLPFVLLPSVVMLPFPAFEYLLSYQRSGWILARKTRIITEATALEVVSLGLIMMTLTLGLGWRGTLAAATSMTLARLGACTFLSFRGRRGVQAAA